MAFLISVFKFAISLGLLLAFLYAFYFVFLGYSEADRSETDAQTDDVADQPEDEDPGPSEQTSDRDGASIDPEDRSFLDKTTGEFWMDVGRALVRMLSNAVTWYALFIATVLVVGALLGAPPEFWEWLEQNKKGQTLSYIIIGFYVSIGLFIYGYQNYRQHVLMSDTPTSTVRGAAMGRVELSGTARASNEDQLAGPVIGGGFLAYRVRIEQKMSRRWAVHTTDEAYSTFCLTDDTGTALINPDNSTRMELQTREYNGYDSFPPEMQKRLTEEAGLSGEDGPIRMIAETLEPDDPVYVLGEARSADDYDVAVGPDSSTGLMLVSNLDSSHLQESLGDLSWSSIVMGIVLPPAFYLGLLNFVMVL